MIINIIQALLLSAFIGFSALVLWQDRKISFGIIVHDDALNKLTNGKQGIETTFGRNRDSDVFTDNPGVSRQAAVLTEKGCDFESVAQKNGVLDNDSYLLANNTYGLSRSSTFIRLNFRWAPVIITIVFTAVRYFEMKRLFDTPKLFIPFAALILFEAASYFMAVNSAAVTECSFSILLSFYIFSMLYKSGNNLGGAMDKCILGVLLYLAFALATKLILMWFNFQKTIPDKLRLSKINHTKKNSERFTSWHDVLRFVACCSILVLIVINFMFSKKVNGSFNWVYIGHIQFQPSELIKLLLLFIVTVPISKKYSDKESILYLVAIPGIVFLYTLFIKDIGALLEMAVIWVTAVILQSSSIPVMCLIISGMYLGIKVILKISATAQSRVTGWTSGNLFDAISAQGAVRDYFNSGYQPVRAIIGSLFGGPFGNRFDDLDFLKGVTASESDLVMASISQKYGYITMVLIFAVMVLIIVASIVRLKQKHKIQQFFTLLATVLFAFAVCINTLGSFGCIPLTGVVLPAVSYGVTSSVSYGIVFGILCSFSGRMYKIKATTVPLKAKTFDFERFNEWRLNRKYTNNLHQSSNKKRMNEYIQKAKTKVSTAFIHTKEYLKEMDFGEFLNNSR